MKQVIIFHGTCSKDEYYDRSKKSLSNSHWIPWLQKNLLAAGFHAHTPEVYEAFTPTYDKWLSEINRYNLDSDTVLVGHSCGAGFLLRWMNENPETTVQKIILVAPWLDPDNSKSEGMFQITYDFSKNVNADKVVVFESDNDMDSIKKSIETVHEELPTAEIVSFKDYGHFTYGAMETEEFPELLEVITT